MGNFLSIPCDSPIPSLFFTKAELAYLVAVLASSLPPLDDSAKINLVEVRNYFNRTEDAIRQSIKDGSLGKALSALASSLRASPRILENIPSAPTMAELRSRFPALSEQEIRDILNSTKSGSSSPPPPPQLFANPSRPPRMESLPHLSPQQEKHRENSVQFTNLLGN